MRGSTAHVEDGVIRVLLCGRPVMLAYMGKTAP